MIKYKSHVDQKDDNSSDFKIAESLYEKYIRSNDSNRMNEIIQLNSLFNIIKKLNLECWIDFGTLLGAYRDKNLISYDIDIDISILVENSFSFYHFADMLSSNYYIMHYDENTLSLYPKNHEGKFGYKQIDIDRYRPHPTYKNMIYLTLGNNSGIQHRSYFFDPKSFIDIKGYKFRCPSHIEEYLIRIYGEDFNIKKKNDHSCKLFYTANEPIRKYEMISVLLLFDMNKQTMETCIKLIKYSTIHFDILNIGVYSMNKFNQELIYKMKDIKSINCIYEISDETLIDSEYMNSFDSKYIVIDESILDRLIDVDENLLHIINLNEK